MIFRSSTHMKVLPPSIKPLRERAFSLVEVTMALGIAAFSLVVILGLFGSFSQRRGETSDRLLVQRSVSSLADYLSQEAGFETVLNWVIGSHPPTLLYANFKSDEKGVPDVNGDFLAGKWNEESAVSGAVKQAADGRWVQAKIEWDPRDHINPTSKPADAASYNYAYFTVRVKLYVTPSADTPVSANALPAMTLPIVVLR